jgi:hypothetical protein
MISMISRVKTRAARHMLELNETQVVTVYDIEPALARTRKRKCELWLDI